MAFQYLVGSAVFEAIAFAMAGIVAIFLSIGGAEDQNVSTKWKCYYNNQMEY
jgi:hypothetical protein